MSFSEYWEDNKRLHPGVSDIERAWDHQQEKIDKLEEYKKRTLYKSKYVPKTIPCPKCGTQELACGYGGPGCSSPGTEL